MPMIDLDAAIAALQAESQSNNPYISGLAMRMAEALRALPAVQPEPAPALGADDRLERVKEALAEALWCAYDCTRVWSAWSYKTMSANDFEAIAQNDDRITEIAQAAILAIPGPTHEQLLADALALEEVRALAEACRDVIAEREIDGQGDCGCDMCMAVDRMTITLAKLKGGA